MYPQEERTEDKYFFLERAVLILQQSKKRQNPLVLTKLNNLLSCCIACMAWVWGKLTARKKRGKIKILSYS